MWKSRRVIIANKFLEKNELLKLTSLFKKKKRLASLFQDLI